MAISNLALNMMLLQHKRRPLEGPVMQLGRQRIDMTLDEAVETFEEHGLTPNLDLLSSVQKKLLAADRLDHMSDFEFFSLFGITDIVAIDLSEVDKPDYIGDLNLPVEDALLDRFKLIIDGGTFDHLFDIRQGFMNMANMLTEGGRVFQWNGASNFIQGMNYCSFNPQVYTDYYVQNGFTDCSAYLAFETDYGSNIWTLFEDTNVDGRSPRVIDPRPVMSLLWSTKTAESTAENIPVQAGWFTSPEEGHPSSIVEIAGPAMLSRGGLINLIKKIGPIRIVARNTRRYLRYRFCRKIRPPEYHFIGRY